MTTMTRVEAEALAAFVSRARPEWRQAGIVAALERATATADVWDVARALINLAADKTVLTPGLLPGPGPHWRKPDGSSVGRRGDNDVRCVQHATEVMPCQACKAETEDMTPEQFQAVGQMWRTELAKSGVKPATRRGKPAYTPDETRRAEVRARLDQEAQ